MDSLSQIALGASLGVAVMGRRTAPWKAALWGAACGTLPDLDALVDHGDPILDMTLHRGDSHSLLWLTLLAPVLAAAAATLHRQWPLFGRWWLALWLALFTHPLLDWMTVYGTQLLRPFSNEPLGLGSIFIIDPLYTLPLLAGVMAALWRRDARGERWNAAGLLLSTAYLAWSAAAQQHVIGIARASLAAQGIAAQRVLVTPAPFGTLLWRIVAIDGDRYHEGFRSLLDDGSGVRFDAFPRNLALADAAGPQAREAIARIERFSDGFHRLREVDGTLRVADLRMGQEPAYVFEFAIGRRASPLFEDIPARSAGGRADLRRGLAWLGPRMLGRPVPPPR
jgi:inner membrane protein